MVCNGLAQGLALLTHGILPVPQGIEPVQEPAEALGLLAVPVLTDGAEGELLGGAGMVRPEVRSGGQPEEFQELCPGGVRPGGDPGIGGPQGVQRGLPADERGEASEGVHKPVTQQVRPGRAEDLFKIRLFQGQGVPLFHLRWLLVVEPRQGGAAGFVQAHPAQAVQDPAVGAQKVNVAGPAHEFHGQGFLDGVAHFVGAVKSEKGRPLHGNLGYGGEPGTQKVLAQEHTEHRGLRGILRGGGGQVEPGGRWVGGDQQLFPALLAAQQKDQGVPAGLVDLLYPGGGAFFPQLLQHAGKVAGIKGHGFLLLPAPGRTGR